MAGWEALAQGAPDPFFGKKTYEPDPKPIKKPKKGKK